MSIRDSLEWREAHSARAMSDRSAPYDALPDLRLAAQILGRTPGIKAYQRLRNTDQLSPGAVTAATVAARHGSWANACRLAGLKPHPRPSSPKWGAPRYSDQEVFERLIAWKQQHGRWPGFGAWDKASMHPTGAAIGRRFGGWSAALRAAEQYEDAELRYRVG